MKIKKTILLTLAVFYFGVNLIAQTSCVGYVVDENGSPIAFANVIGKQNDQFIKGTSTGEYGEFDIDLTDVETLAISCIGYKDLKVDAKAVLEDNWVVLKQDIYSIPDIVVSAMGPSFGTNCKEICWGYSSTKEEYVKDVLQLEFTEPSNWTIYPNPATDFVSIKSEADKDGLIQIIDVSGKVLANYSFAGSRLEFGLDQIPNGTFILRYYDQKNSEVVGKLIKVKE